MAVMASFSRYSSQRARISWAVWALGFGGAASSWRYAIASLMMEGDGPER